jgi:hypothetical protein
MNNLHISDVYIKRSHSFLGDHSDQTHTYLLNKAR